MTTGARPDGTLVFGIDPPGYDRARPDYPDWVFDLLTAYCPIGPATRIFEIGPGTGIATRRLLAFGPASLLAIEPNQRLAEFLAASTPDPAGRLRVQVATFDHADVPEAGFDLGVAATTFHWLDPIPTLHKVAASLRPGGTWAMWWNVFGNALGIDHFHEATKTLMATIQPQPPADPARQPTFPIDSTARLAELAATGFVEARFELLRWTLPFDVERTQALYATFPHIRTLPDEHRERVLAELGRIVTDEFAGVVERTLLTPLYLARRP